MLGIGKFKGIPSNSRYGPLTSLYCPDVYGDCQKK
jgi:hypothetical protein